MDIRTKDYILKIRNYNTNELTAHISKEEYEAIISGVGRPVTFVIQDNLGDIYNICMENADAIVNMKNKEVIIYFYKNKS